MELGFLQTIIHINIFYLYGFDAEVSMEFELEPHFLRGSVTEIISITIRRIIFSTLKAFHVLQRTMIRLIYSIGIPTCLLEKQLGVGLRRKAS